MAIRYPDATRAATIEPVNTNLSTGAAAGTIKVYTGAQPASAGSAASGTLLVTFTLNDPAFTSDNAGTLTLVTTPAITATASASGTAGWFRAADSNGATVFDGSVGTTGTELNLNTTAITSGGSVSITSGTVTQSAG